MTADAATPAESIRPRACLEHLPAYIPGAVPDTAGRTVYKVSSNESPFEPLPAVEAAAIDAIRHANRYPDMGCLALRTALSERHGVTPAQIAVSTGSSAVIGDLIRALVDQGDEVVYAWRSFEAYPILVGAHGGTSVPVPLTATHEHDLDAMAAAITERTKLVLVCTPNNPSGTSITTEQMQAFLQKVPAHVVVGIDEAYREFDDPATVLDTEALFHAYSNVVLLRTFSKMQGLAGLRIGYAVAHPVLATALVKVSVPFGASLPAQAAAFASLDPEAQRELVKRAEWLCSERDRVQDALAADGWDLPRSRGNFVYFPLGERTADFAAFCEQRGLIVRPFLGEGARVTIAEQEANDLLIQIAREWRQAEH